MKRAAILLLAGLTAAAAQPTENITVTGKRMREEQIQSFVQSRAAPAVRLGKIARWEVGICPAAAGLKPELLSFILQRVENHRRAGRRTGQCRQVLPDQCGNRLHVRTAGAAE